VAFIEASLEELPVRAYLGPSCSAMKISAPGPNLLGGSATADFLQRFHGEHETAGFCSDSSSCVSQLASLSFVVRLSIWDLHLTWRIFLLLRLDR
jgi:hypothetical protein